MGDEEADLLAELRKISNRSAGSSRFDDDHGGSGGRHKEEDNDGRRPTEAIPIVQPSTRDFQNPPVELGDGSDSKALLSPWRRYLKQTSGSSAASGEGGGDSGSADATGSAARPAPSMDMLPQLPELRTKVEHKHESSSTTFTVNDSKPDARVAVTADNDSSAISKPSSVIPGERGGAAEDAELLALLRGVSMKSASASRFDDGEPGSRDSNEEKSTALPAPRPESGPEESGRPTSRRERGELPPWKRRHDPIGQKQLDVEVVTVGGDVDSKGVALEPTNTSTRTSDTSTIKSETRSTFEGERGGAAEDAELLALIRGVSLKSASASRFDDGDGPAPTETKKAGAQKPVERGEDDRQPSGRKQDNLPPWKRDKDPTIKKQSDVEVVIFGGCGESAMDSEPEATNTTNPREASTISTFKSGSRSAFQGERGGAAEDAELLALLRGVSSKSASASRFDDDEPVSGVPTQADPRKPMVHDGAQSDGKEKERKPRGRQRDDLPPWKRRMDPTSKKESNADDIVLVGNAPEPSTTSVVAESRPTFQGQRDGEDEDAQLLALSRGVSAKSASSSRFATGEPNSTTGTALDAAYPAPAEAPSENHGKTIGREDLRPPDDRQKDQLPPWKRRRDPTVNKHTELDSAIVVGGTKAIDPAISNTLEPRTDAFKSEGAMPFRGERGGAAEDDELLALLRGVSSNSASASRFDDEVNPTDSIQPEPPTHQGEGVQQRPELKTLPPNEPTKGTANSNPSVELSAIGTAKEVSGGSDDIQVTRDSLAQALQDKNWKVRVAAFEFLSKALLSMASSQTEVGNIDSDHVFPGLDDTLPKLLEDSNAVALDKALELALLYAEHCKRAGSAEQASKMISALVQKNAFSSRPSTAKSASNLSLKLMEVGTDAISSIHAVINILLAEGMASKKPKVVQASVSLILEAAVEFGASTLPLAPILAASPKALSHSNASVRNNALQILAEVCRALGSKSYIQEVLEKMKKSQVSELEAMLAEKPEASPPRREVRSVKSPGSNSHHVKDAVAALQENAKELAAQRFAARPAVNLVQQLASTDYSTRIVLTKWSEKVAALASILDCAGQKPYKLVPQSSTSNYAPLIGDLKKLLGHTHFAVCTKSMEVLAMLAEGVGETLFPYLRPFLVTLLKLSKDKKLTNGVNRCLDSFFGTVLGFDHLLDSDDSLLVVVDETKERNALSRATGMEFLVRCIERNQSAGPRGSLSKKSASAIASLCLEKLDDSNAAVRKACIDALKALRDCDLQEVNRIANTSIESLKEKNPRAYKVLSPMDLASGGSDQDNARKKAEFASRKSVPPAVDSRVAETTKPAQQKPEAASSLSATTRQVVAKGVEAPAVSKSDALSSEPPSSVESALVHASSLRIPLWDAPEDDSGVLAGLISSKWMLRQDAIKSVTAFIESGVLTSSTDLDRNTSSLLLIVGEHTRDFKDTNVNIMRSIIRLFISICEIHEAAEIPVNAWVASRGIDISVGKITDKKLADGCRQLLTGLCVVHRPTFVLTSAFARLKTIKSPLAHEEFLKWLGTFCDSFGAFSLGSTLSDVLPLLIEECESSNVRVKREALQILATCHSQVGPSLKAIATSLARPVLRDDLEKCFESNAYDINFQKLHWPKRSLLDARQTQSGQGNSGPMMSLDVPRSDILADLGEDCLQRLTAKDGKAAWKVRKEALEEVEAALKRCTGLVDVSGPRLKFVVDLLRALRDRLSDTQINLKPVAARVISILLSSVDKPTQARLARIVYAPLINVSMNDIKKATRDATLDALRSGTIASDLEGGGINEDALEPFVAALVGEVNEASSRAGGLPDVLQLLLELVKFLPSLDDGASTRGQSLGEKYAGVIVECLTSSKSETRAAATSLLELSIERSVVSVATVRNVVGRLKPAKQRSVGPIVAKLATTSSSASIQAGKENDFPAVAVPPPPESYAVLNGRSLSIVATEGVGKARATSRSEEAHESLKHPLLARRGVTPKGPVSWVEYPEEPTGLAQYTSLKLAWSSVLPPSTAGLLFPPSGIRKQDDAQAGCKEIVRAVAIDSSSGGDTTESQIDFILKWLAIVLCTKEATVGLHELLSTVKAVFDHLIVRQLHLGDVDSLILVPFLIEKASSARGRFRDLFMDVISRLENEALLSSKLFGTMCVTVVERSSHAKGRLLACRLCAKYVTKEGLAVLGKRGMLSVARSFSEESIPENKAALLEVMLSLVGKMNGDIQRLARLCDRNLSERARQLIEERWAKMDRREHFVASVPEAESLPALGSIGGREETPALPSRRTLDHVAPTAPTTRVDMVDREDAAGGAVGTAAALRARLLKVRERSKLTERNSVAETESTFQEPLQVSGLELFNDGIDRIQAVVRIRPPLDESNPNLLATVEHLKLFHAAVSKQPAHGITLSAEQLDQLRKQVLLELHVATKNVSRLIRFAFECGPPSVNAGISIPLLSVCLATLMALLRDPEVPALLSQDDLKVLIVESGTALLDSRLSGHSDLDEATSTQMVRAINKLAVQAATGAPRTVALQSLLDLQVQLLREGEQAVSDDAATLNSRLSRVVSKLFARVVKAEEAMAEPYSLDTVDLEVLVCSIEDVLREHPSGDVVADMSRVLTESLVTTYGASNIIAMVEEMNVGLESSLFSSLVLKCVDPEEDNAFLVPSPSHGSNNSNPSTPPGGATSLPTPAAARDVASLVSALGSAPQGPSREKALEALREYREVNGQVDLDEHLRHVSHPFRAFIEQQLQSDAPESSLRTHLSTKAVTAGSMSARLQSIRSRLNETDSEIVLQSTVGDSSSNLTMTQYEDQECAQRSPTRRTSRLAQPTPSKLLHPSQPKLTSSVTSVPAAMSLTLRERMAASQETRRLQQQQQQYTSGSSQLTTSALSSSATLRARLEAARRQPQPHEPSEDECY